MHFNEQVRGRLGEVIELQGLAALGTLADQTFADLNGMLTHFCDQLLAHIEAGFEIELVARLVEYIDRPATCIRQGAGVLENARQHYFQLKRRADSPSYFAQGGEVAIARFDFLKQPRILDGDDSLVSKSFH